VPAVVSKRGVDDGNKKRREGSFQPAKKNTFYIEMPYACISVVILVA